MAASIFAGYVTDLTWSQGQGTPEPCHAEYKFMDRKAFQLCAPRDSIPTGCLIVADLCGNGQYQLVAATAEGYIAVFDHTSRQPIHTFQDNRLGSILFLTSTKINGAPVVIAISAEAGFHVLGLVEGAGLHLQISHRVPISSVWCVCPVFLHKSAATPHFALGCMDRSVYLYSLAENGIHLQAQWSVGAMVHHLALHQANEDDPPLILAGLQGRYAFIDPQNKDCPKSLTIEGGDHATFMFDVVGNVLGRDDKVDGYYIVSPQNGTIVVCTLTFDASQKRGSLLSRLQVGVHFWVQTGRMLLNGLACHTFMDGRVQLAACTWGGIFFLVDMLGRTVGFNAMKRVRTWASGPFTLNSSGDTQNCLFYHGFSDEICCCYDLQQYSMPGESLLKATDFAQYPRLTAQLLETSAALSRRWGSLPPRQLTEEADVVEGTGLTVSRLSFDVPTGVPVLEPDTPRVPLRFLLNTPAVGGPLLLRPSAPGLEFDPPRVQVPAGDRRSRGFTVNIADSVVPGSTPVTMYVQGGSGNVNLLPPTPFSLAVELQRPRLTTAEKRAFLQSALLCTDKEVRCLQWYCAQLQAHVHRQRGAGRIQRWWRRRLTARGRSV
eukprot:GGOE01043273.1.p1 GENE.GGOE01043273.1~~GGOE01043273.1.p1  ORF type:complete len:605 (-),score=138.86 GGOE01043273.1:75-1889(-)